ncbi:AAA family ATPase [Nocardioides zeae]
MGRRADGVGLFYPGKTHTVASESEGGKTWFALSATLDEINAGNHVVYVDFEDDAGPLVGRLLTLGANRELLRERFHYVRPEGPVGTGINSDDLAVLLGDVRPTLAILDGVTEAMTLHGLNPLDNADAAKFGRMLPRRLAESGAACVSLDHVTKSAEGRGRYSIGAVHKLNALDGAAYVLENRKAFGVGITGKSSVKIAKDRPGQLRKHALTAAGGLHWFGDLVLDSRDEGFAEVEVVAPEPRDGSTEFRPTAVMAKVSKALAEHGKPMSQRVLRTAVGGKGTVVTDALNFLILDGYVTEKTPHELIKPYVEGVAA